ncbi:MAG TPA: SDR family NAD(P)-dependent oxidoreductase, partial [Oceanospirillales bacterium]|nr:SDR family NAD(P)-dependent oxidoreductase [Oceanospirillales bacterium]
MNENIQTKLSALKTKVNSVEYLSCNLSKWDDVNAMIATIMQKYGSLDGIIHAAGVIKDGFLWNKELSVFKQVLDAKIKGTENLDLATKNIDLSYFILCSSIAATNGNMGQSDYAAGNRFMDDFAMLRQQWQQLGLRKGKTLSINWPLWRNGGMQVNATAEKWLLDNWGMKPLSTEIGLAALHYGLSQSGASFGLVEGQVDKVTQALEIDYSEAAQQPEVQSKPKVVAAQVAKTEPSTAVTSTSDMVGQLQEDLTSMVIELLKIDKNDIEFSDNMSTYGFDSVTFTEFTYLINTQLELDVTPLIFFEQETLDELTEYLLEDFADDLIQHYASRIESTDENEVEPPAETSAAENIAVEAFAEAQTQPHESLHTDYIVDELPPNRTHNGTENSKEPIAIIGINGTMPQSKDVDSFWNNLLNKKNLITEIPKDRWDWKKFYGESDLGNSKTTIKWGGFMPEVDKFDAEFFHISPLEAELTDPQQRLFLQSVWHTIEDAGYKASDLSGTNTGVFVGIGSSDYHELLREQSSDFEAYSVAGWMHAVLANRISYFFNWSGASEPIGTACSSTLVAVDRAVQAIRNGKCDMCIAGGVSMLLNPGVHVGLGKAAMLADDGRCKTFDHKANGYVRSEGVGALLLKPLSKAQADGDHIYAVIKGSAVNHGGHVNTFTTPNPKAQAEVLQMAFADADIDPATLTYIETHGTGTALGDPIEIQGLLKAFKNTANKSAQMPKLQEYCTLGSVKTNA